MKILIFVLATVFLGACASKPPADPGGKWAKQAEMMDNSLFY